MRGSKSVDKWSVDAKLALADAHAREQLKARELPDPEPFPEPVQEVRVVSGITVKLTRRELDTIKLVAEGHSNKTIGAVLDISQHTAKFHVTNLMRKLEADNRAQIAAHAVRMGLA
jgi:DNA-binding CsgD family transcriptional regulator